jgi:hypothetical protein
MISHVQIVVARIKLVVVGDADPHQTRFDNHLDLGQHIDVVGLVQRGAFLAAEIREI